MVAPCSFHTNKLDISEDVKLSSSDPCRGLGDSTVCVCLNKPQYRKRNVFNAVCCVLFCSPAVWRKAASALTVLVTQHHYRASAWRSFSPCMLKWSNTMCILIAHIQNDWIVLLWKWRWKPKNILLLSIVGLPVIVQIGNKANAFSKLKKGCFCSHTNMDVPPQNNSWYTCCHIIPHNLKSRTERFSSRLRADGRTDGFLLPFRSRLQESLLFWPLKQMFTSAQTTITGGFHTWFEAPGSRTSESSADSVCSWQLRCEDEFRTVRLEVLERRATRPAFFVL